MAFMVTELYTVYKVTLKCYVFRILAVILEL